LVAAGVLAAILFYNIKSTKHEKQTGKTHKNHKPKNLALAESSRANDI